MAAVESLVSLEALGPSGTFRSSEPMTIKDLWGQPVASLSLVPPVFASRALAALRRSETLAAPARGAALARAAEIFRTSELGGLGVEEYQSLVSRVSGLALPAVRESTAAIAKHCEGAYDRAQFARPQGAVESPDDERAQSGCAVWVRKGQVLAVHAAGNHPGVHTHWLQAVALGYRVAVRPSRREPFTAHRLVLALREAGFPDEHLAVLPTDYEAADVMLRGADRSIVFGGDDVIRKYRDNPRVLAQGPGRSKILITADVDWRQHLDLIVDSVSRNGGVGCTNTTAVFVESDHLAFAKALGERLSALPSVPLTHPDAVLPVYTIEAALRIQKQLEDMAVGSTGLLPADGVVHDFGDGTAALRPALHVLPEASSQQARAELPFPCVWVAPWARADGTGPFEDTLAITVIGTDRDMVDRLLQEPTVRNVYAGSHPTYWTHPAAPHDGYLGDFLMESKGFIAR